MNVIGIDPGPTHSGYVVFDGAVVYSNPAMPNEQVRGLLTEAWAFYQEASHVVAIEMIASYGMAVGADVFLTCVEIGRFVERSGSAPLLIPRMDVKMHLCGSPRAKDANIRQALIDKLGPAGNKANPGPTYGVSKHAWAALAIAVTAAETRITAPHGAKPA